MEGQEEENEELQQEVAHELSEEEKIIAEEAHTSMTVFKEKIRVVSHLESYSFYIEKGEVTDFRITLTTEQAISMGVNVYEETDGVYNPVGASSVEFNPLQMSIYQSSSRIYQKSIYSMSWDHIDGKENTTYLIRFSNGYQRKLVLFKVSAVLEEHHFHDKATV